MSNHYDLEERLIEFAVATIDLVEELPSTRSTNHIGGQLLRSGTSPAPNYAEAQGAESRKDFVHKIKVVLKELKESRVWLKIIKRKKYLSDDYLISVMDECEELVKIKPKSIQTASAPYHG